MKSFLCLWKIFSVYEFSYLWNVLSIKCPPMKCLSSNCLFMKCPIYEMSYLWNVLSMKCPIYEMSAYGMSFYEINVFLSNVTTPVSYRVLHESLQPLDVQLWTIPLKLHCCKVVFDKLYLRSTLRPLTKPNIFKAFA